MKIVRNKKNISYSSSSAMINFRSQFFLIGDDAPDVLCLDADWKEIKRIKLLNYSAGRIPKPIKPDLEAALIWNNKLYLLGSGSKLPQRSFIFEIDLENDKVSQLDNLLNYERLNSDKRITELNMESALMINHKLLLINKGNISNSNSLIWTQPEFLLGDDNVDFDFIPIELPDILKGYGISDATYIAEDDVLLLTATFENTTNAYDDGEIGGSVFIRINEAQKALAASVLRIENYIDLNRVSPEFNQQKIEAVCLCQKTKSHYNLFLAADNDDGLSQLFEIQIERNS